MIRILCVDDNSNSLYMLDTLLQRAGYEVVVASSGEEAVLVAAAQRPALVLMDLTLPGIDGCEATRQIRALPEAGKIPIIALSGHDEQDKGADARAAGCNGYARKPIQIRPLLTLIGEQLAGAGITPRAATGGSAPR